MTLIPVEHPRRLASPAEAEAFYQGLRERWVSVRGFHTTDPVRVEALVTAVDLEREHTISFCGGTLGDEARAALVELCGGAFGYFELRTPTASLRVWPGRYTWVDALSERSSIDWLETTSIGEALARFDGICGQRIAAGHIRGITETARAPLLRFAQAAGTEVHVVLEVSLSVARSLTEQFPGQTLDWQSDMVLVDFPEGRINGFLKTPKVAERDRRKWQARIDKALSRARLL